VSSEEGSQAERKTCLTEEVIKARKKSGDFGTTKTDGGACRSPELTDLMPRVGYILTSYLIYSIHCHLIFKIQFKLTITLVNET